MAKGALLNLHYSPGGSGPKTNQRNQNPGVAKAVGIRGNLAFDHSDFVAIGEPRARDTVLVDFVGQLFATRDFEAKVAEEAGRPRKEADAANAMATGFVLKRFDERSADAVTFVLGPDGDRANLGEVSAVQMKSPAANDSVTVVGHHKVANIFRKLRHTASQQRARIRIRLDNGMDAVDVWEKGIPRFDHDR